MNDTTLNTGVGGYSPDTEVLTWDSWKYIKDVREGEMVLTLRDDHIMEYQPVQEKYAFAFNGDLIHIKGMYLDLLVTPESFLYTEYNRTGADLIWRFKRASDIYGKYDYAIKKDGVWRGASPKYFELPGVKWNQARTPLKSLKIPIEDWLRFFGLWLADGYTTRVCESGGRVRYRVGVSIFDSVVREEFREVLDQLPFIYRWSDSSNAKYFAIVNKQLYTYLSQFGKAPDKFIPREFLSLCPRLLRILGLWMIKGDGCAKANVYYSSSYRLVSDLQGLILKMGYTPGKAFKKSEAGQIREVNGHTIKGKHPLYAVRIISPLHHIAITNPRHFSRREYKGNVYNVLAPNRRIYVRRNGTPCWSSSSWGG